jgi:hypothetical protein
MNPEPAPPRRRRRSREERRASLRDLNDLSQSRAESKQRGQRCVVSSKQQRDIAAFQKIMRDSAKCVCICCDFVCYPDSVVEVSRDAAYLSPIAELVAETSTAKLTLCKACEKQLRKRKLPPYCLLNGLRLGPVPPSIKDLTMHEIGLISPIRCFQQIHVLPLGQRAAKGISVFMPIDLQDQVDTLPRPDSDVVTVRLPEKKSEAKADPSSSAGAHSAVADAQVVATSIDD